MTTIVADSPAASEAPVAEDDSDADRLRRRRRATALYVVAYLAFAIIVFLPHSPFSTRSIPAAGPGNPAGSDPFQMAWFLAWLPYALTHGLNIFHTTGFDYPTGVNLADNTTVPLLGFIAWPITANLGPIAAFNFLIRLAFALSGISMFAVLRRWCSSLIAPFVGGLFYAFGPYMTGQELHLDLAFVPIPPLLVWCADELIRTQRMRPWRLGILIGVATTAQLLISPDVLSGCMVLVGCAVVVLVVRHRRLLRERWRYLVSAGAAAAATFALLSGYLIWDMIAGPNHLTGAVIPTAALQGLHSDLLGTVVPTVNQILAPSFLSHFGDEMVAGNLSENGTYLGLPLLILLVAVFRRCRSEPVVRTFGWLAVTSFVLSLGSRLNIGTLNTHIPLPELVFAHLPLLDNTIPARYSLYTSLFVAMLLGIGLDRLWQRRGVPSALSERWRSRLGPLGADSVPARRARVGLAAGIVVLLLVPNVPFPSKPPPWPSSLTREMRLLVPPGSVVLAYPYPTPLHPGAMLWAATAGMDFHLLGGYANIQIGNSGHRWPPLLSPPYVQELLGYSTVGDHWPLPTPANAADLDALHVFLARYSVGAVVYWAGGDDRIPVYTYLAEALGPPTLRAHRIAIWLPVSGHWRWPHHGS
jgi:hypothetical protein